MNPDSPQLILDNPIPVAIGFLGISFVFDDIVEELLDLEFPVTIFCDSCDVITHLVRCQDLANPRKKVRCELACTGLYGRTFQEPPIFCPESVVLQEAIDFKTLKLLDMSLSDCALARSSLSLDGVDQAFPILSQEFESVFLSQQSAIYQDGQLQFLQVHYPNISALQDPQKYVADILNSPKPVVILVDSETKGGCEFIRIFTPYMVMNQDKYPFTPCSFSNIFQSKSKRKRS